MSKINATQQLQQPPQEYYLSHQTYTQRQVPKDQVLLLNKENKTLQNLLAAVELNRTTVVDQMSRQNNQQPTSTKDHYQSHREFGRDLSNNAAHNGTTVLNAKIINTTTHQGSSNVSIFKNFIQQYQSHSGNSSKNNAVNGNSTQVNGHLMTKLDLNTVNISGQQHNYPSSRGNHHSTVIADEARAQSSQAVKTFDAAAGSRNQSTQGNYSIREGKMDPLRRKLNSNIQAQTNTRRVGGGELIKLGQKLTEMPRGMDDEKSYNQNSSLVNGQSIGGGGSTIIIPTKTGNVGTIISRAAAAQQIIQQKSSFNGLNIPLGAHTNTSRGVSSNNYNTHGGASQPQSLQSSQIHYKLQANKMNLHQQQQQQHMIEDKENKREFANRQNVPGTVQSANNVLKRSKTTDPSRAPLRQKDASASQQSSTQQSSTTQQPSLSITTGTVASSTQDTVEKPKVVTQEMIEQVAKQMEDRRKDRMKTLTRNLEVCDLLDMRNPQSVAEFAPQIYKHMHQEEIQHIYPCNFMQNQSEVTEKMRAYLIDWLSELHLKFKLWPETMYVCVGIIDKFLMSETDFKKKDLQCLGITALHIAGKYEEIYPPELKHILRVTDNAVAKDQVLKLEYRILQKLDFNLTFPSILRFMERYSRIAQVNEKTQMLAQYFCDTCLLDCTLMKEKPSKLAAVSIYAAQKVMKGTQVPVWNATMTKNTNYKEDDVRGMAIDLLQFIKNVEQSSLQSIYKKYSQPKFLEVTKLLE